jgi:hypothetical protein
MTLLLAFSCGKPESLSSFAPPRGPGEPSDTQPEVILGVRSSKTTLSRCFAVQVESNVAVTGAPSSAMMMPDSAGLSYGRRNIFMQNN